MKKGENKQSKEGSALSITVVLLFVSAMVIGSIITLSINNSMSLRRMMNHDKAFYLADAGLRVALIQIKNGFGVINNEQSRRLFDNSGSTFSGTDWGFNTSLEQVDGRVYRVKAQGFCGDMEQQVEMLCYDATTNKVDSMALGGAMYQGSSISPLVLYDADFINGSVHSEAGLYAANAQLDRSEHDLGTDYSDEGDSRVVGDENWVEAGNPTIFEAPATPEEFVAQQQFAIDNADVLNVDGQYNPGEAFLDVGNGVKDAGELVLTSVETMNEYRNENPDASIIQTGDDSWFVDEGDGLYTPGEEFVDDRNGTYDRGATAAGSMEGLAGSPADGELPDDGYDDHIYPPDLASMYYHLPNNETAPGGAAVGWGHDIRIDASTFGGSTAGDGVSQRVSNSQKKDPEHIFVRNPRRWKNESSDRDIPVRTYTALTYPTPTNDTQRAAWGDKVGNRIVDDYFLEDTFHSSYGNRDNNMAVTTSDQKKTAPEFVDVNDEGNNKVYYVDGNLWIHSATAYAMRFTEPGTKITIIANGNITISDEFYYNGTYGNCTAEGEQISGSPSISYEEMNSTKIENPLDNLCLIAMKNPDVEDVLGTGSSGNIYIGDPMAGTGGSIHAKLYAENNFVDKNLNTANQPFISIYGCMAAGNKIDIKRSNENGKTPTRLDITADPRSSVGAPPPGQASDLTYVTGTWKSIPGTWKSASIAEHYVTYSYDEICESFSETVTYDDGNNGHGNDPDGYDPSNPGNS